MFQPSPIQPISEPSVIISLIVAASLPLAAHITALLPVSSCWQPANRESSRSSVLQPGRADVQRTARKMAVAIMKRLIGAESLARMMMLIACAP